MKDGLKKKNIETKRTIRGWLVESMKEGENLSLEVVIGFTGEERWRTIFFFKLYIIVLVLPRTILGDKICRIHDGVMC